MSDSEVVAIERSLLIVVCWLSASVEMLHIIVFRTTHALTLAVMFFVLQQAPDRFTSMFDPGSCPNVVE